MQNKWLFGALIALLGTVPILLQLSTLWRLNGLITIGIGTILTFIFISKEEEQNENND